VHLEKSLTKKNRSPGLRKIAAVKQKSHDVNFVAAHSFGLFVLGTTAF